ncbi:MAG: hypothetical protein IT566_18380 [Rhodospirillaceae bacterium]|nr:hypothetical protein [Rhodospirillaceae bacterium]
MTSALLLRLTEDALAPLIADEGGTLTVGTDPAHVMGLLSNGPGKWRVILLWEGATAIPDTRGSAARGRVAVILQQARGLSVKPGNDTHRTRAGDMPILDRSEQVAAWVRSLRYYQLDGSLHASIDCHAWQYLESSWLPTEGAPSREYSATFDIGYCLGLPEDFTGWVTVQSGASSPMTTLHDRQLAVDASAGAVTLRLPAQSLSQRAVCTTGHSLTVTDDSDSPQTLYSGVQLDRPSVGLVAANSVGGYDACLVTFPAGSRGVVGYTALTDLGDIEEVEE